MSVDRKLFEIPITPQLDDLDPSERITLPYDVPPPPSLAQLPHAVLHSATVETLIGQNEDLHARLTVTIRMNAQLERRLIELEQNQNEQRHMNGSLISQMQILQEKDGGWKARFEDVEHLLEGKTFETERQQVEIELLQRQYEEKSAAFEDLKSRLFQASSHIQSQEKSVTELQAQMSEEFEGRLASVLSEYNRQSEQIKELEKRIGHLQKLDEARIETENRAIYFERRAGELETKFSAELGDVQTQLNAYRAEAKSLAAALQTKSAELNEQTQAAQNAQAALTQLEDQFESLQTIWHEGSRKLDETRLKHEALTKINAELSRKLKELRRIDGFSPAAAEIKKSLFVGVQPGVPQSMIESENENGAHQAPLADSDTEAEL